MSQTTLATKRVKTFRAETPDSIIIAQARFDDECGNGHNTFAITAEIYEPYRQLGEPSLKHSNGKTMWLNACGCCHEEIEKHFPQLAPLIKWHLCSTDGPIHYIANALYWAGHTEFKEVLLDPKSLGHLKSTIIYGALDTDAEFSVLDCLYNDKQSPEGIAVRKAGFTVWLNARLPALMAEFQKAVESLGFTY